ncbi:hypothetical protein NON27_26575, partial [Vibrio parahaemolyticus]|nr:hypothetical protein [Vibrio parahaemolyticus]
LTSSFEKIRVPSHYFFDLTASMTFIPLYSYNDTLFLSNKNLRLPSLESSLLSFLSTSNQIATKKQSRKNSFSSRIA